MLMISYLRVSKAKQGRTGLGVEAQREAIRLFADAHDIGIVQEFVEVETGKGFDALERRPVLAAAFAEARRRKCAVLVAKLDRLSRNSAFIGALIERKVPFFVAELGLDVDRFMLHIHAAVGEKEREMIGERTKAALAAARRRGVTRAGKPFAIGNPKIHLARRQAARAARSEADRFALNVAPLIRPLRDQGLTLAEVAQALDARGVATVRGGAWSAGSANACVRRAGLLEAGLRAA
jgi:DNA invertase Pin-like site-specific DNA recombinase